MAFHHALLGPPKANTKPATATTTATPPLGFTENNSLTYKATCNPCLDFFFHTVPNSSRRSIIKRLEKAWDHDPLTFLKLVCNLRAVRGTGKSDKEGFFACAFWLHKYHPKTLAYNLSSLAEFGCFKDLVEILFRLLEGHDVREKRRSEWERKKDGEGRKKSRAGKKNSKKTSQRRSDSRFWCERVKTKMGIVSREERIRKNLKEVEEEKQRARETRKEREAGKAKRALGRYHKDPDYRVLHDQVAQVFADFLRSDVKHLHSGQVNRISLASKWCPNLDSSYDKTTLICDSIARRVFPKVDYPEYFGIEDAHYAYRVRDRLRKEVLVPLRKVLQVPEVYIGANKWGVLPYDRVSSIAMDRYRDLFIKHDPKRFLNYLDDVKKGDAKIAGGALLPHKIIRSLNSAGSEVAQLQWNRMVEDLTKQGKLRNCIAVCDVSAIMEGNPMDVCVALGLLISELSEDPWKGKVITFSEKPTFHLIEGDDLRSKTKFIRDMDSGLNTNFQKVFDKILKVAVKEKISEDQMVKRVFVFSDMEFDKASRHDDRNNLYTSDSDSSFSSPRRHSMSFSSPSQSYNPDWRSACAATSDSPSDGGKRERRQRSPSPDSDCSPTVPYERCRRRESTRAEKCRRKGWETDYEVIRRKFREKGFSKVPEIVFWNLRDSESTPVTARQEGVVLLSGFSKNLVKLFFDNDGICTPMEAMELALSSRQYQELVVYD